MHVPVYINVNFNIESMVTQTHTQRMGLNPFSASTMKLALLQMGLNTLNIICHAINRNRTSIGCLVGWSLAAMERWMWTLESLFCSFHVFLKSMLSGWES